MGKYARIQGRIYGPLDDAAIKDLTRQGKIGRFTEISEDRRNWVKAEDTPLFSVKKQKVNNNNDGLVLEDDGSGNFQRKEARCSAEWFYSTDGITGTGPCSREEIKEMLLAHKIDMETLVWRQGDNATPLKNVPELLGRSSENNETQKIKNPIIDIDERESEPDLFACVSCGKMIEQSLKFCPYCGKAQNREKKSKLRKVRRCSECNGPIELGANRCPRCGGEPIEEGNNKKLFMYIALAVWLGLLLLGGIWYFFL